MGKSVSLFKYGAAALKEGESSGMERAKNKFASARGSLASEMAP